MRLNTGIVSGLFLASLVVAKGSAAQQPYPPQPAGAPPGYPQQQPYPQQPAPNYGPPPQSSPGYPGPAPQGAPPAYPGAPVSPGPGAPVQGAPTDQPPGAPAYGQPPAGAAPGAPGAQMSGGASTSAGFSFSERDPLGGAGATGEKSPDDSDSDFENSRAYRRESLKLENTIDASTGLLRVQAAGTGAPGTFRFSLLSSYFSGSDFLCPPCAVADGGPANKGDSATHITGHVGISVTPIKFLEAYMGIHTTASSNTIPKSELLQVLGDTNIGLKAFMPYEPDQTFTFGGGADVWLLNGLGSVGIDNANFGLRGLATADFNNRRNADDRIPLRLHLNLGYLFENSGKLVDDFEKKNDGTRITRVRRFGLGINRVDSFRLGFGVEGVFDIVRPFVEWTADVPVNRQNHVCDVLTRAAGDQCLGQDAKFSAVPSRISLGARLYPFLDGLSFLAAFDIGTGATSNFIEEVAPEVPWNFWLGAAFAVDSKPQVEIRKVEAPAPVRSDLPKQPHFIQGSVVEKGSATPVPDAIVRFDGRNVTGMVTMADGTFRTGDLDPGTYTFNVSATGYRDGQCTATIPFPGQPGAPAYGAQPGAPAYGAPGQPAAPYGQPPYGAAGPVPGAPGAPGGMAGAPSAVVTCEVESLPKVGNVNGQLHDAESGAAVSGAQVKITDKLGRSLSLTADESGAFRFENVPPGPVSIAAEANGYLKAVVDVEVKAHTDVAAQLLLTKRPTKPNVVVTAKEIKLKKEVHFQTGSAEILPDSMGILSEIADTLASHAEIRAVEIQGHTDDQGNPEYNQKLSTSRANAVREALVRNGVESGRLTARGYGQERPLAPNTNEANRARNRRVQLIIEK